MRKRDSLFLIVCIAVLIALVFLMPEYGWKIQTFLRSNFGSATPQENSAADLMAQNEALKAQLAELQSVAAQLPAAPSDYLRAIVYSRYPMNFKNEILVNAGSGSGVQAGKAVVFKSIFIGTVEKTFSDSALVQTVFDSGFKTPVRVGQKGYDALFMGGASPRAVSIKKDAALASGDIVYTAASGFPYGMPVAVVVSTSTSPDNLFEEATLGFAYDVNAVQTVLIAR